MKKLYYLFLFIYASVYALEPVPDFFQEGNRYHYSGNYKEAITNYEYLLENGRESAELYFNLGNCYYKLQKVAPAIYNYEKALQLNPNDEAIKTNLEFAQKLRLDDIKVIPNVGFSKLIEDVISSYHYDTWAWIAIAFGFIFSLLFLGYYFSKITSTKRLFFTAMIVVLIGIITIVFFGFYEKMRIENLNPAIIFNEATSLKSEPKPASTKIILLHEGTKVYVLESIANWKKVQLTDERIGWIESNSLKELN